MIHPTLGRGFTLAAVAQRKAFLMTSLVVAALLGLAGPASAANKFWVGAGGDTNNPTGGTWQTSTPTVWSDGTASTADAGWTAGDAAFFGGADGAYGIQVGGAISMVNMNFLSSGYALTNSAVSTITGTGSPFISVGSGKTATIGANVTVTVGIATVFGATAGGAPAGTLIIDNGGIVQQTGSKALTINGAGTVVSVKTGGKLTTPNQTGTPFALGNTVGDNVTLRIDGGLLSIQRNSSSIWICPGPTAVAGNVLGTLTITNGGTVTEVGGFVSIGQGAGNVGTLNLDGGTLTTAALTPGGGVGAAGAGMSIVNFNGGTLKAQQAAPNFATLLTAAYVRNGGALINNNNFAVTIAQALLHTTNVLDNPTDGGLTSSGTGTLTLTGANTYNGPTTVSVGKLVTTTASIGAGAYTVASGATLEVQVNTPNTSLTNSSLTLGTNTLVFTLTNTSATIPAIQDNGALNLSGLVTVNVTGPVSGPSTNLLLKYNSLSGTGSFVAGSLPVVAGYTSALINDTVNKQLKLIYVLPTAPVQWAVGNGNWDTTSLNWQLVGGSPATNYYEFSPVTFDDNAIGAGPITVTLSGSRNPANINFNNSAKDYVLTGGFGITGGNVLTKTGSGTVTLAVNSAHSGGTDIEAGTLQVGNGGTAGSLGAGDITDNSELVVNLSGPLTLPGAITGSGGLTKNGNGTLTLSGTNSYSGDTVVNGGELAVNTAATGGNFTVADGATLAVQASDATSALMMGNLTLGTASNVTNNFTLPAGRSQAIPVVSCGAVALNGTVTVNVAGGSLASGTYILLQYSSLTGSGSFVAGAMPGGIWTLTNDTVNQKLEITGIGGLVWDSGNTNNGGGIDPADGTWDLSSSNTVWNNGAGDVSFVNGNNAVFAGADGTYNIKVGASVSAPFMTLAASGYNFTNDTPQSIALGSAGAVPTLVVDAGKTMTIGTNVTINNSSTTFFGTAGDTPGGTIIIENGGVFQENTGNSWVLDGAGTTVSVRTGGLMRHASTGSGQFAIGANNTGNPATLSVDGGTVLVNANNCSFNIASGPPSVAGVLTLNSGLVSMAAGATLPLNIGTQSGDLGTLNLNGGTLSIAQLAKGAGAISTNNFNGGILRAINGNFAANFMTGLDRANVRNGGAVFDSGAFAITIGQELDHSDIPGDNATDGGLTKLGAGSLALTAANTYTGPTTVSNGTLLINGSIPAGALVKSNATLGGSGVIGGSVTVSSGGTLAPGVADTSTLTIAGNLVLQGNLDIVINESASPSNNFCSVTGTLTNAGAGVVTVTNLGTTPALGDSFTLFNKPVPNGGALTIVPAPGAGLAWTNRLALNGSIAVVNAPSTASYPTNITFSVSGNTLTLTWPATHLGWIAQSNSVSIANSNFWFDIAGSASITGLTNAMDASKTNVFYRLRHP